MFPLPWMLPCVTFSRWNSLLGKELSCVHEIPSYIPGHCPLGGRSIALPSKNVKKKKCCQMRWRCDWACVNHWCIQYTCVLFFMCKSIYYRRVWMHVWYMCAYMFVCACTHACGQACICMWRIEVNTGCLPQSLCTLVIWDKVSGPST